MIHQYILVSNKKKRKGRWRKRRKKKKEEEATKMKRGRKHIGAVGDDKRQYCDFDAGLSNLAGLFLQDKTSRVVGSQRGLSNDQARIDLRGEVRRPA
ncbi:hypothetical protein GW17_00029624 [Ensete ventricosum]|nr:hypothetical protein GW17_00029624 [Ensete ventricosum]